MSLYTGHFSRPRYDKCAYPEDLYESTSPYEYTMNPDRIHNCRGNLTIFGPRSGYMGAGVSTPTGDVIAASQQNVDIDSVLSNRNVPLSRCRRAQVNPIDVTKIRTRNLPIGNDYLDGQHTKMTDAAMFYRGCPINRFYDLNKDPQANIYYDWAVNTRLEAKDNFVPQLDIPFPDLDVSAYNLGGTDNSWMPKALEIDGNGNCGNASGCFASSRTSKNNTLNQKKAKGKGVSFYAQ
jgi:hypothetical protein